MDPLISFKYTKILAIKQYLIKKILEGEGLTSMGLNGMIVYKLLNWVLTLKLGSL